MRISAKGQVTIPADIRERAGLLPRMEVAFVYDGDAVRIVSAENVDRASRGKDVVSHMTGRGGFMMSTDEIMALTRSD